MSKEGKKLVESITSRAEDFAQWYTDIVKKAELCDYSPVRGCMILRPYGYAIWENIQRVLDGFIKESGHQNVAMPLLIPESLLQKEKDHVEGFAPEVAWVTHGGSEELAERLCIRPTSETLFCEHYARIINSYRDLPKLYNQWCSVIRWEKTTRPFLRTSEFLWQEGHTVHATEDEAVDETISMLDTYAKLCESILAMPIIKGQKTDKEKFAGAVSTYTIEAMMHDGKSLQAGTSHFFGDGFAKSFDITYTDRDNRLKHPFQTSWGVSTRLIGGIIMTHGDDDGLILPPAIAPIELVIIPIQQQKEGVLDTAYNLFEKLKSCGFRCHIDSSDHMPGWKFAEYEMKGVPVRLELGPKDIEKGQCVLVRRDTREKLFVSLDELEAALKRLLQEIQENLYNRALANRENRTFTAHSIDELISLANTESGFIKSMWCGCLECEERVKEQAGLTSRCMPMEQESLGAECAICGKPAKHMIIWGKAY